MKLLSSPELIGALRTANERSRSVRELRQGTSRRPGGLPDGCGALLTGCWSQAAAIQHVFNPFGADSNVLLSPQKAIDRAMRDDTD